MSTDLLLKITEGNTPIGKGDLQRLSAAEEKYVAHLAGVELNVYRDVSDSYGTLRTGTQSQSGTFEVGSYVDTKYNEQVGTHPESSISITSTTTYLNTVESGSYPNTSLEGTIRNRPLVYGTVDDKLGLHEINDTDLDTFADKMNGLIVQNDYAGSLRLEPSTFNDPTYEKVNTGGGGTTTTLFTDRRTDGTSVVYHIWRKKGTTGSIPTGATSCNIAKLDRVNNVSQAITDPENLSIKPLSADDLSYVIGKRCKYRRGIQGNVGTYQLRSSGQGVPTDTGTWASVGTATDIRNNKIDVDQLKPRVSGFIGERDENRELPVSKTFNRLFVGDYLGDFIKEFVGDFIGNFAGEYTTAYEGNFIGSVEIDYTGAYTGDYVRQYEGNYIGDFIGNYTDTYQVSYTGNFSRNIIKHRSVNVLKPNEITYTGLTFSNPYAGDYTGDFIGYTAGIGYTGNYTGNFTFHRSTNFAGNYGGANFEGNYASVTNTRVSNFVSTRNTITPIIKLVRTRERVVEFIGNYEQNRQVTYTGDFSRDFVGDYTGVYVRDFTGNYTGDFIGDFVGNYTRQYTGNYTGDFIANFIGNYLLPPQNYLNSVATSITYTGNYTQRTQVAYSRVRDANMGDPVYSGNYLKSGWQADEAIGSSTDTDPSGFFAGRAVYIKHIPGGYTADFDDPKQIGFFTLGPAPYPDFTRFRKDNAGSYTGQGTITYVGSRSYVSGTPDNPHYADSYIGFVYRTAPGGPSSTYVGEDVFVGNYVGLPFYDPQYFVGNYVRTYEGNYIRDYTGGLRLEGYTGGYIGFVAYTNESVRRTADVTVNKTYISTRHTSVDVITNYTREPDVAYARETKDSITKERDQTRTSVTRITNYVGDFQSIVLKPRQVTYTGNFSSVFVGDFIGDYTEESTLTFEGNFVGDYIPKYTGDYIGNFQNSATSVSERVSVREGNRTRLSTRTIVEQGDSVGTFVGDYVRQFAGDFIKDRTRNSTASISVDRQSNNLYTSTRQTSVNTLDYVSKTFTGNFQSTKVVNRSVTSTRDTEITYINELDATANYQSTQVRNRYEYYTGVYTGDFIRTFSSTRLESYVGNYIGSTIQAGYENIQTYTLYVRTT